jgi:hypothetical protein
MFESNRRSRKPLILPLILFAIFLGSNVAGYMLSRDQIAGSVEPERMPDEQPYPFGRTFRILLPQFTVMVPFELEGFSLYAAYPDAFSLRYEGTEPGQVMHVKITNGYEPDDVVGEAGLPESWLLRNGLDGRLMHETFGRGTASDGISYNPYWAIREGLVARLRGRFNAKAAPDALMNVFTSGDSREGQIWRVYGEGERASLIEGSIFSEERFAEVAIQIIGAKPRAGVILKAFAQGIEFGDFSEKVALNEKLADRCVPDVEEDVEAAWEPACRQTHQVALLVSFVKGRPAAQRLFGEYLLAGDNQAMESLYRFLREEVELEGGEGKLPLLAEMEKQCPWLVEQSPEEK